MSKASEERRGWGLVLGALGVFGLVIAYLASVGDISLAAAPGFTPGWVTLLSAGAIIGGAALIITS